MPDFPHHVPGYLLEKELGSGGFGVVYRAREDSQLALLRAVKIIDPHELNRERGKAAERFKREARSLSRLEHPAIVKYVASGFTEDDPSLPFLVTELIAGESFQPGFAASDATKARKMADVLDALSYAHAAGVFHRDIKPSNVFVREGDGQPIILDFGMAFLDDEEEAEPLTSHYAAGSVPYIPPEVVAREQKGRSNHDIFSCAVMFYQLLTGKLPNSQAYQPVGATRPSLAPLDDPLMAGLAEFRTRVKTASEFAALLRQAAQRVEAAERLSPDNPAANDLLRRAVEQKEEQRQRKLKAAEVQQAVTNQWNTLNAIVEPAAKKAFEDLLPVAQVGNPEYRFEMLTEKHSDPNEPVALWALVHPQFGQIRFGHSGGQDEQPLGAYGQKGLAVPWTMAQPNRRTPRLAQQPQQVSTLRPQWLVWSEGGNQHPRRIMVAAVAAIEVRPGVFELFGRPTLFPGHQAPVRLAAIEDVRTYLTEAIGRQFVHS